MCYNGFDDDRDALIDDIDFDPVEDEDREPTTDELAAIEEHEALVASSVEYVDDADFPFDAEPVVPQYAFTDEDLLSC